MDGRRVARGHHGPSGVHYDPRGIPRSHTERGRPPPLPHERGRMGHHPPSPRGRDRGDDRWEMECRDALNMLEMCRMAAHTLNAQDMGASW